MSTQMVKNGNGNRNLASRPMGSLVSNLLGADLNRWLDDSFWGADLTATPAQVPVNIQETNKSYELELSAPGLKKSDFKVALDRNLLTISFEHTDEREQESEDNAPARFLRREFRHQSFRRSFTLDDTVDAQGVTATYEDGILKLSLPKKEEAQRLVRNIEVG